MADGTGDWKCRFEESCKQGALKDVIEVLQSLATPHAGTAHANVKNQAIKSLKKLYKGHPEDLYRMAVSLCDSEDATAQEIGTIVLAAVYQGHGHHINYILHHLADSPNWEVREWVASACGSILGKFFDSFYPIMVSWTQDESENVRRTVALAAMYAGKSRNPAFANPLLDLIEILLPDRAKYVRDNLGPFAIGSGLIKYYPDQVIERLGRWVHVADEQVREQVRWNIAMVFTAANGAQHALAARDVLSILSTDTSPYVQKAVETALKNIKKRCPEFFS